MLAKMTKEPDVKLRLRDQFNPQMSFNSHLQQAVCIRRGSKRYGSNSNPVIVLDGLNMTVPKGVIYRLLGASGCGKTTLVNCIVGTKRLNSGEIWVLGGTPGSKASGVPGPRVGYMPQEIALYGAFTIRETCKYLGWISNMTTESVEHRLEFLAKLFMLPDVDQAVKNLSGGEQRRVSLVAALLHEPELLILDEPTVGLDPLLRQNIWDHFVEITNLGKTTIILTTHYIEESRQAHKIGLMRGGYFLAEESPDNLLAKFDCKRLENVFLKLSVIQNEGKINNGHKVTKNVEVPPGFINKAAALDDKIDEITGELADKRSIITSIRRASMASEVAGTIAPELPSDQLSPRKFSDYFQAIKPHRMYALMWKNFLWMWKNIDAMTFIIALPIIQLVLACFTIGHDPEGLSISVVNYELEEAETCRLTPGCNSIRLSCNYLDNLQNRALQLNFYSTEKEAKDSVLSGDAWAALVFANNFSSAMKNRIERGLDLPQWDIVASSVEVYQDKSNEYIAALLYRKLFYTLEGFIKEHLLACGINGKVGTVPIRWEKPIYGSDSQDFTDFVLPGIMITTIFSLALAATYGCILIELNEGMLQRAMVHGITGVERLFSLIVTQSFIVGIQSAMVIVFAMILNIPQNGNMLWVTLLILMTGLCGMCFGFMMGCVCDDYTLGTYIVMGSLFPILILCGIAWPVEGMSIYLKPTVDVTKCCV